MKIEGNLLKMRVEQDRPVRYFLPLGEQEIFLNDWLGKEISLFFNGRINCISCGKLTKTSFGQGFCYSCLQTSPEASESVLRPELSKAHFGIARDLEWAARHDLIDHYVYLALSSDVKVGVTRNHQVPTRWIDQGASAAVIVAQTPNRHIAGVIEVWLKQFYTDKTNWRDMLLNKPDKEADLLEEKQNALRFLPAELQKYAAATDEITRIEYPALRFPEKIKSLSFDKQPEIRDVLTAIKGQYLIFDSGSALNVRKHSGYHISVTV